MLDDVARSGAHPQVYTRFPPSRLHSHCGFLDASGARWRVVGLLCLPTLALIPSASSKHSWRVVTSRGVAEPGVERRRHHLERELREKRSPRPEQVPVDKWLKNLDVQLALQVRGVLGQFPLHSEKDVTFEQHCISNQCGIFAA